MNGLAEISAPIGRGWRWAVRTSRAHPIAAVATATAVVSLIALVCPEIDLAVTAVFYRGAYGFPLAETEPFLGLRRAGMEVTHWIVVALAVAVLAKAVVPMLARAIPMRSLLFLLTSLALGPGLLVNVFFKEWWGRPRPDEVVAFGGPSAFMPAWVPGGECLSNCSFPSGEASGAIWLIALVFVVPPTWRRAALALALAWTAAISLNRIAFGRHFLSDVMIAWGLVAMLVLICRVAILERMPEAAVVAIDHGLAALGARFLAAWKRILP